MSPRIKRRIQRSRARCQKTLHRLPVHRRAHEESAAKKSKDDGGRMKDESMAIQVK